MGTTVYYGISDFFFTEKKPLATIQRTFRGPEQESKKSAQVSSVVAWQKDSLTSGTALPYGAGLSAKIKIKANQDVPYAVGAMLAISAIASEVLASQCNLTFKAFLLTYADNECAADCYQ